MIANRANVSIGSLYHIFPDKAAIARSISKQYASAALEKFANSNTEVRSIEDLKNAIHSFVRSSTELLEEHAGYYAISRSNNPSLEYDITRPIRGPLVSMFCKKLCAGFDLHEGVDELKNVLDIAIETTRHFLNLASSKSKPMSTVQLDEIEALVTHYVVARFEEILIKNKHD